MGAAESKAHQNYAIRGRVPQSLEEPNELGFTLWNAVHKQTGETVSVFHYTQSAGTSRSKEGCVSQGNWQLVLNNIQRLKTIRHPGVLRYKDSAIDNENAILATEAVIPLKNILRVLPPEEVLIGVHSLLKTIAFLHTQNVAHNRITLDSLYVAETATGRRWLLGGFELACSFEQLPVWLGADRRGRFLTADATPPEDLDSSLVSGSPGSRDAYCLGQLLSDIISPFLSPASSPTGVVAAAGSPVSQASAPFEFRWRDLQDMSDRMSARNPTRRPTTADLAAMPLFADNALLNVVDFFRNIRALTPEQKLAGFKRVPNLLRSLPASTINAYVLPLFLSKTLFNEPGLELFYTELFLHDEPSSSSSAVSPRHANSPLVPGSTYRQYVLPFVGEMLRSREFGCRLSMLKMFENYVDHLINNDPGTFQTTLIPEILSGFEEYNDEIYVLTYTATCAMIPALCLLGADKFRFTDSAGRIQEPAEPAEPEPSAKPAGSQPYMALSSTDGAAGDGGATKKPAPAASAAKPASARPSVSGLSIPVGSLTTPSAHEARAAALEQEAWVMITTWIVDRNLVPKAIRACVWEEEVTDGGQEKILKSLCKMWKRLCEIEFESKRPDVLKRVRPILRSCSQCFYLVLRVLPKAKRHSFLEETLVGNLASAESVAWLPRVVELLIPFLKDDSNPSARSFRNSVANIMSRAISSITDSVHQLKDPGRVSVVAEEEDEYTSLANNPYVERLRHMYARLPRRAVFPKSGPREPLALPTPAPSTTFERAFSVQQDVSVDGDAELWTHWSGDGEDDGRRGAEDEDEHSGLGDTLPTADPDSDIARLHRLEAIRKRREARGRELQERRRAQREAAAKTAAEDDASLKAPGAPNPAPTATVPRSRMDTGSSSGTENIPLVSGTASSSGPNSRSQSFSIATSAARNAAGFRSSLFATQSNAVDARDQLQSSKSADFVPRSSAVLAAQDVSPTVPLFAGGFAGLTIPAMTTGLASHSSGGGGLESFGSGEGEGWEDAEDNFVV
ncbi:hypothetical protein HDU96_004954 [Phlyctochytrium bullatum]|nr:hypothetical protein HDU96_004954 [Phlyctochytrium bullatum]